MGIDMAGSSPQGATMSGDAGHAAIEREAREGSALQALLGYRLIEWEPDRAVVAYDIKPDHLNRTGRLHGGILATLLDTAGGFAGCFSADPEERRTCVTLSLTVNYVASMSAGRVLTEARRTGGGHSIFFAEIQARDGEGRVLASGTGAFRYLSRQGPETD